MKTTHFFGVLHCLALAAVCSTATAQEGWSLSRLNPFARHASSAHAQITDQPDSGFSLPKFSPPKLDLWPKWPAPLARKPGAPSALSRLGGATRNLWSGTTRVLMPWRHTNASRSSLTGARTHRSSAAGGRIASRKPFYSFLLPYDPPEKKTKTVTDFLAQPKPTF